MAEERGEMCRIQVILQDFYFIRLWDIDVEIRVDILGTASPNFTKMDPSIGRYMNTILGLKLWITISR